MAIIKEFAVNLPIKGDGIKNIGNIVQNDVGSNKFVLRLMDGNKAFNLTGYTAITFTVLKPDGTVCIDSLGTNIAVIDVINGEVSIMLHDNALDIAGTCLATLEIYAGAVKLATSRMGFSVTGDLAQDADATGEASFPVLQALITQLSIAEDARDDAEVIRLASEISRVAAENARVNVEANRVLAEGTRVITEVLRDEAEIARVVAEIARVEAEEARVIAEGDRDTISDNLQVWQAYNGATAYVPLNKVVYNGSSYVNTVGCTGVLPTDTSNWLLIASKGTDGICAGDMIASVYDPIIASKVASVNGKTGGSITLDGTEILVGGDWALPTITIEQVLVYYDEWVTDLETNKADKTQVLTDVPAGALFTDTLPTVENVGFLIDGATDKTTPADSDFVGLMDSAGGNILKKLSWANLKSAIATYYNALTASLTNKTFWDTSNFFVDASAVTKKVRFDVNGTAGITGIISTAFTTAKTVNIPDANDTFVMRATTDTLTNKRVTKRTNTEASSGTSTPTGDATDIWTITALAAADTIAAPTGTPTNGQELIIRIKDNGTARALTWNAIYRSMGVVLPTTTIISKTMYCWFIYNSTDSKWDLNQLNIDGVANSGTTVEDVLTSTSTTNALSANQGKVLNDAKANLASPTFTGTVTGVKTTYTATLPSASWTGSASPYSKAVTVTGILSTDTPLIDIVPSGTYATDVTMETNWAQIYRMVTSANTVTFYAHAVPTADISLQIMAVR